jgi:Arc/MetJ family transcription regulator
MNLAFDFRWSCRQCKGLLPASCSLAAAITSIRRDKSLADEAAEVLGNVKSRTEAVHRALREIVALKRFKLMSKYGGKLEFSGHDESFCRLRHFDLQRPSPHRLSPAANPRV